MRDTKLEKQNHEATPKHQGNLQRFLRDLHRGHEREGRDAQRAKDEVARLNGISASSATAADVRRMPAIVATSDQKTGRPADRKKQLQQLADMGIAIPEEARREMAMVGDWQTQSMAAVGSKLNNVKQEDDDDEENKPSALAVGVRKRKHEGDGEKKETGPAVLKKGWGSTTRSWNTADDGDLEALLNTTKMTKPKLHKPSEALPSVDSTTKTPLCASPQVNEDTPQVKREDPCDASISAIGDMHPPASRDTPGRLENDMEEVGAVFKKRKAKPIRQKG